MKIFKLLLVASVLVYGTSMLTACSHFKGDKNAAQSSGAAGANVDAQDGFADENSPNRLKAPYNQVYHFGLDKYEVDQNDIESVNVQAAYLVAHQDAKVRLEGNTDSRGSREYNIALGWKRAKAVAAILKQQGVSDTQIATVSYGKEKLVADGDDENAHRLNRRTDLVYEAK